MHADLSLMEALYVCVKWSEFTIRYVRMLCPVLLPCENNANDHPIWHAQQYVHSLQKCCFPTAFVKTKTIKNAHNCNYLSVWNMITVFEKLQT